MQRISYPVVPSPNGLICSIAEDKDGKMVKARRTEVCCDISSPRNATEAAPMKAGSPKQDLSKVDTNR